jgi:hypothetical protein
MIESHNVVKNPVRVIRSWNLNKKSNPYRPQRGFRYDGLYIIDGSTLVDSSKAIYKFHLTRLRDQDPIRYQENAARRPTRYEVEKYDELRIKGTGISREDW